MYNKNRNEALKKTLSLQQCSNQNSRKVKNSQQNDLWQSQSLRDSN